MCQTAYVTPGKFAPGYMTVFFLLQAPAILLERALSKAVTAHLKAACLKFGVNKGEERPAWLLQKLIACSRTALVFSWLAALAEVTFWPALEMCKVDVNGAAEVSDFVQAVLGLVHLPAS